MNGAGAAAVVLGAISAALLAGRGVDPLVARLGGRGRHLPAQDEVFGSPQVAPWPEHSSRASLTPGRSGDTHPIRSTFGQFGLPHKPSRRLQVVLGALIVAVLGGLFAPVGGLLAGMVAAPIAAILLAVRRSRYAARRRAADVVDGCLALAGELGSGATAHRALAIVAADWPELFAVAARQSVIGGDPAAALRESAHQPGAEALAALAAAWEVSERTGAQLSSVLRAVADSVRAESAVRREAEVQLASVRATSRLMALLPVATLALFSSGGGGALRFLTGTRYGLVCMVTAAMFIATGLFWVDRTARGVRSAWVP